MQGFEPTILGSSSLYNNNSRNKRSTTRTSNNSNAHLYNNKNISTIKKQLNYGKNIKMVGKQTRKL